MGSLYSFWCALDVCVLRNGRPHTPARVIQGSVIIRQEGGGFPDIVFFSSSEFLLFSIQSCLCTMDSKFRRCHITCRFNTVDDWKLFAARSDFTKARGGICSIACIVTAYNEATHDTRIYMESDQTRVQALYDFMESVNAISVDIDSFSGQWEHGSSRALASVVECGQKKGFIFMKTGNEPKASHIFHVDVFRGEGMGAGSLSGGCCQEGGGNDSSTSLAANESSSKSSQCTGKRPPASSSPEEEQQAFKESKRRASSSLNDSSSDFCNFDLPETVPTSLLQWTSQMMVKNLSRTIYDSNTMFQKEIAKANEASAKLQDALKDSASNLSRAERAELSLVKKEEELSSMIAAKNCELKEEKVLIYYYYYCY